MEGLVDFGLKTDFEETEGVLTPTLVPERKEGTVKICSRW